MERIDHILRVVSATVLAGLPLGSCSSDDVTDPELQRNAIRVNTVAVAGTRAVAAAERDDNTFMVLFWQSREHLESASGEAAAWTAPYLAGHAPQPVAFYKQSVFDTRYPYPLPADTYLYATGYAPGKVLKPDATEGYRRLVATIDAETSSRYDFLGCDAWNDVYRGSLSDPFSQEKNKLYFRHLASKLIFYADREKETMENKQFVRKVRVKRLSMSIDGDHWTTMYTPSVFEWKRLDDPGDFTASYEKVIEAVTKLDGNKSAGRPKAGYKATEAGSFAGPQSEYVLEKNSTDRVPIYGMSIDSCYVCNPIEHGEVVTKQPIRLKMDISAEMSFDPNFPMSDDSGSDADNLTFTREWKDVTVDHIYRVTIGSDGKADTTDEPVTTFKPGNEYRIYIHFNRTGVNLVAKELPWNYANNHYITIPGGDKQNGEQKNE